MSGFEGVLVAIVVLVVGAVFACVGLSYAKVEGSGAASSGNVHEPEVADRQGTGSRRQAA